MLRLAYLTVCAFLASVANAGAQETLPPRQDYTQLSKDQLLDFRYSFPTLVGSHPQLLAAIRADRSQNYAKALEGAREDVEMRRSEKIPFHPHQFWRDWIISGQTGRLISLRSQTETFTGGAHGMHTTGLLLWDDVTKKKVGFSDLFVSASAFWPLLQDSFCRALAAERARRVQMEDGRCPKPEELVFIPGDSDSDWKFDTIQIVADPYVAGSYAEGRYEVSLAVTDRLIEVMRPEFRELFEAQRQ